MSLHCRLDDVQGHMDWLQYTRVRLLELCLGYRGAGLVWALSEQRGSTSALHEFVLVAWGVGVLALKGGSCLGASGRASGGGRGE